MGDDIFKKAAVAPQGTRVGVTSGDERRRAGTDDSRPDCARPSLRRLPAPGFSRAPGEHDGDADRLLGADDRPGVAGHQRPRWDSDEPWPGGTATGRLAGAPVADRRGPGGAA